MQSQVYCFDSLEPDLEDTLLEDSPAGRPAIKKLRAALEERQGGPTRSFKAIVASKQLFKFELEAIPVVIEDSLVWTLKLSTNNILIYL